MCLQEDADDLGEGAEGERVRNLPRGSGIVHETPLEEAPEQQSSVHLAPGRPQRRDARVEDERVRGIAFVGERRGVDGEELRACRVGEHEGGPADRHGARVAQRVPVLRAEPSGSERRSCQRFSARQPQTVVPRFAAADRDRGDVRREAEIGGADGAAARDHRSHAALDHCEQELEQRRRDAGAAPRQPDAPCDQRSATDALGERLPHAEHATANELLLEVLDVRARDAKADVGAEAVLRP